MSAPAQQEDTGLWGPVIKVIGQAGSVATLLQIYDWIAGKWTPQWKAGDMWLCPSSCDRFSPPGSNPTYLDHGLGNSFIQAALPGRQWNYGDKLVVCNGQACFVFEYRGGGFFATGRAFQDPHVGYATPPASAPNGMSGGGGGYSGASRVLAPNVTYRSGGGMRTGHVTVHWGPGVGVTSQK